MQNGNLSEHISQLLGVSRTQFGNISIIYGRLYNSSDTWAGLSSYKQTRYPTSSEIRAVLETQLLGNQIVP